MTKVKNFLIHQWTTTSRRRKALTLTTILLFAAAGWVLLSVERGAAPTLQFPDDLPLSPGAVSSQVDDILTDPEVEQLVVEYTALVAWAEVTQREASTNGADLLTYMFADPSTQCAQQHRTYRNLVLIGEADPPDSWIDYTLDCARTHFHDQTSHTAESWGNMRPDERAGRANLALSRLWLAVSPAQLLSNLLAFERRIDVKKDNDPQFAEFSQLYQSCVDTIPAAAGSIARANPSQIPSLWLKHASLLELCASRITQQRFPIPSLEDQPTTPPEIKPPG